MLHADMAATMPSSTIASTVVDLSRLPAPPIVPLLDAETILAAMQADFAAAGFDALVDSDPAIKVMQIAAYREALLRQAFQDSGRQLLLAYATGANLDHLAALLGVTRLVIVPADRNTGAVASYETDDSLRQRVVLAPEAYSVAGPELAYVAHAKAASADVLDASAISPAPGEVLVSILSAIGDGTASAVLIGTVQTVVTDRAIRPLGDHVVSASAKIVPFAIRAALTTFSGPDIDLVLTASRTALDVYLTESRKLGRNIRTSGLEAAMKVSGVENVVLTSPAGDIICDATQAAHCTAIAIDHAGFAE